MKENDVKEIALKAFCVLALAVGWSLSTAFDLGTWQWWLTNLGVWPFTFILVVPAKPAINDAKESPVT